MATKTQPSLLQSSLVTTTGLAALIGRSKVERLVLKTL
jgi:hypothetical protein